MQRLANPLRFRRLSASLLPWTGAAAVLLLATGTWLSLLGSPRDYQQGETVRIMYVHVPAAWMAMFAYANLAIASAVGLVWRHPLAEVAARAMAPLGAAFTALCLVTGSLWGKPMWGTWWVWDARLTSVLLLFLLYLGYIALANAFEDEARGTRAASILALVGAINLPVIKFSVDWWNTLHQPASVSRLDAPALHPSMLLPLLVMALAFMAWFATVLLWRIEAALAERRLAARRMLAEAGTATPAMRR
jgi:heme exporter protein C